MDKSVSLDEFENNKQWQPVRSSSELVLTRQDREELLMEWGATFHDIIEAIRANVKAKHQRRRTVNAIGTYDRWEEVMENASRKIKRTLTLKKPKQVARNGGSVCSQSSQASAYSEVNDFSASGISSSDGPSNTRPPRTVSVGEENGGGGGGGTSLMTSLDGAALPPKLPRRAQSPAPSVAKQEELESLRDQISVASSGTTLASHEVGPKRQQNRAASAANIVVVEIDTSGMVPHRDDDETTLASHFEPSDGGDEYDTDDDDDEDAMGYRPHTKTKLVMMESNYTITEEEHDNYIQMEEIPVFYVSEVSVNTHISEFTSEFNSTGDRSNNGDGNFDSLVRDSSFWELRPGQQDAPMIQRRMTPVIISEDASYSGYGSSYGGQQQQPLPYGVAPSHRPPPPVLNSNPTQQAMDYNVIDGRYRERNGFTMQPPPNSSSLISKWD